MTKAASQPSAGELEERGILSPVHTPEPAPRETETPARARRHRVSCLINHYNYGAYVEEAVASVLAQTHAVDEVVLVDDGSDPDHLEAARRAAASSPLVRLIEKENGGQLSCFQIGVAESSGDVVFFLDADDVWEPGYVERCLRIYEDRAGIDFIFTHNKKLFTDGRLEGEEQPSADHGYSVAWCLERGGVWVGAVTSCLSMRRKILDRIFPVVDDTIYRVCADEVLVYGASIAGARKYFLGEPLVRYRVHGKNAWFGKADSPERAYLRRLHGRMIVEALRKRIGLPPSLMAIAHYEYRTVSKELPTRRALYKEYCSLVWKSDLRILRKVRVVSGLMSWHYFSKMI